MGARDWFESIRAEVIECARMEADLLDLRSKTWPRGQALEMVAHSTGATDGSGPVIRVADAERELDVRQARCNAMVEDAMDVLYGVDGRGGLARLKGSATADCICGHYLMGMRWQEVADELARPESKDARQWCKRRAYRGMEYIDRVGASTLTKS